MKVEPLPVRLSVGGLPSVRWSRVAEEPRTRDGGDPLGFRAAANRTARRLAPGLTQSTTQVRGFGLLVVGLHLAGESTAPDEAFQRFERLVACLEQPVARPARSSS